MPIHWTHTCPEGALIRSELVDGQMVISCEAPGDPPDPNVSDMSGTEEGWIGVHHYSLDWEYKDGEFNVTDLDITISLDDEIG